MAAAFGYDFTRGRQDKAPHPFMTRFSINDVRITTRFRENVTWVARGFRAGLPTHVACYDLAARTCEVEHDLEPTGLGAVYSIFPAVEAPVPDAVNPRSG